MISTLPFTLSGLADAYAKGVRPAQVVTEAFARLKAADDPGIFLHCAEVAALAEAEALGRPDGRPLWGVPFVVKDNIDVAGMPTTAACPDLSRIATADAFVVARLRAAGAIVLGKTNLDQFATGLVGVRTPGPAPRNAIDPALVPGGSSSGSAVAVARGIAAFSLGTDTAGSGRVPAALNALVGLKPTLGTLSAGGMIPACRTLDTISVFAHGVADAWAVYQVAAAVDPADAYSRAAATGPLISASLLRIGVPDAASLRSFGDRVQEADFRTTVERLRAQGATVVEIDFTPFYAVAAMLYEGAWLAERVAAVGARLTEAPETLHPVTRAILEPGLRLTAVDAFRGFYRLQDLRGDCLQTMAGVDVLCVPTIPNFVTLDEIAADPIGPNARIGTYTNFVNLLDLCGIAVPTGDRPDGRPGSITVLARSGRDGLAASVGAGIEAGRMGATGWPRPARADLPKAAAPDEIALAVCGAHMSGLPLNPQLTRLGARLIRACRTAPEYRLYALPGGPPQRPGLVRDASRGAAIAVEVWGLPRAAFGGFIGGVPSPLAIGTVRLEDDSTVNGFLCETAGLVGAADITALGGWRGYLAQAEAVA
ncbi:MAG: allophanate hydrolase [Pseudomonadota bacterium]